MCLIQGCGSPFGAIHLSVWKVNSRKLVCSFLQRISSKVRKGFVLGPPSVGCRSQRLGVADRYAGMRIMGYVSPKLQTVSGCAFALGSPGTTSPD